MISQPDIGATREFLDAIFATVPVDPKQSRYLILAAGRGIYMKNGKPDWKQREELPFLWPDQCDAAISEIEKWAPVADVWLCPYLHKTPKRAKGNAAWRQIIHTDCDKGVDLAKVRKLGGFVVWSGTADHGHVYVPLSYTLSRERHERLCEGQADYLDGDRGKVRDNDLLRVCGSFNHKPTLQGGQPVLVKAEKP